ncbi:MAG: metallophosphoesterase [Xanthobacteraceae bacterium]|nr:MAG: metallophosphoesterase [Xanthobacteraceae bacterium]
MLIALLTDIHSNRQAFEACLAHAHAQHAERFVFLGDYVGYGADPEWVIETVREYVGKGAIAIVGNHDRAVSDPSLSLNHNAQIAIEWTRGRLGAEARAFLDRLPIMVEDGTRLYVHADPAAPARWHYVADSETARHSLEATRAQTAFVGHVHVPALYGVATTGKLTMFQPVPGVAIPLLKQRRWLSVVGSVGQPRDGNPAAAYAILNATTLEITFWRVPYDIETAAARIRAAGLPDALADRLSRGR